MNRNLQEEIEEIEEEAAAANYVNAPACTVEKMAACPDQRFRCFSQYFLPIAVCWLILLVIMGLRIYLNQELETERDNLRGPIQNISRAQWSIDEYCPKENNVSERRCRACQKGWELIKSSCYLVNDAGPPDQKIWEEAREDCRARSSDLVVVQSRGERNVLSFYSGYGSWVGLRAEGGRWKWIDGSYLTESVSGWIHELPPPADGQCVVHDMFRWRSVSCAERNGWICEKKALSV